MKNKSAGFFLTALSAVAAIIGLIAYLVNTGTNYFVNLGVSPAVAGSAVAAIAAEIVYIIVNGKGMKAWADILPVLSSALLIVATVMLVSVRVNGIASIMTFENNASNMSDLTSAIVGIAACLIAAIVSIISSFFDVVKE